MALIQFGPAVSAASGAIGGTVFSHNRGGAYLRTRVVPTKVVNPFTTEVRDALSATARLWAGLSTEQREAWREYATANPSVNRLGQSKTFAGHVAFNQINARLIQQGVSTLDLPPIAAPPDPLTALSCVISVGGTSAVLTTAPTPLPAGVAMWVWAAPLPSAGALYLGNKMRLIKRSAAAQATGLDVWAEYVARFGTPQVGQTVAIRVQTIATATGLVSSFKTSYSTVGA